MAKSTNIDKQQGLTPIGSNSTALISADQDGIPTLADKLWLSRARKLSDGSVDALNEGAKGIMTGCTFFISVYVFILADATEKSQIVVDAPIGFAAPLIFFGLAMISAVLALIPLRYRTNAASVTRSKEAWNSAVNDKYFAVWISLIFLALGLLSLVIVLVIYASQIGT